MAEIKCSYDTSRRKLAEIVPLESPLSMYIEPTKKCNFKCYYCMHSTRGIPNGEFASTGYQCQNIDPSFYSKVVKDIMNFRTQPKRICFSGLGEPLMNPKLPDMALQLREAGYKGRIDVITNGCLLSHEIVDAMIHAGFTRIQISIQGLDANAYHDNCGVRIDYQHMLENISYLYEHRDKCTIYIKIIDALLDTPEKETQFFDVFSPICDQIFVEHLIVIQQQMESLKDRVDETRNLNNEEIIARDVCPVCFYHLQVSLEGYTFPCPVPGLPENFSLGNAKEESLQEIWNGKKRKRLLNIHLNKKRYCFDPCGTCMACATVLDENENLDDCTEIILKKMEHKS